MRQALALMFFAVTACGLALSSSPDDVEKAYIKASDAAVGDYFGLAVAIDGDTLVVGAPNHGINFGTGAVYVFVRHLGSWTQQALLTVDEFPQPDEFGCSVAIDGDTIVVGARLEDSNAIGVDGERLDDSATDSGAAYVFVRAGATWSEQAYLKATNTGAGDDFGSSVTIFGDTIVVGAHGEDASVTGVNGGPDDDAAADTGAAYVFVRNGATWTQEAYLKAINSGGFGYAVALSRDTLVVGAPGAQAAYVFVRDTGTWTQQATLKASNADPGDSFGESVAVDQDTVVVGAPLESSSAVGVDGDQTDNGAWGRGAAYVFARSGSAWHQDAYLKADPTGTALFGRATAIRQNVVVIGGNILISDGGGYGAVEAFVRKGGNWRRYSRVTSLDNKAHPSPDGFGARLAVSGTTIVAGAFADDSDATGINGDGENARAQDSGAVYVLPLIL